MRQKLFLFFSLLFRNVLQVDDGNDQQDQGDGENSDRVPYEIERIATVFAVTCMFLSALYSIFAILLFLFFGNKDRGLLDDDEDMSPKQPTLPAIVNDPRREKFITMDVED